MTIKAAFSIPSPPLVPITRSDRGFPVRRIFCVGRNYAAHAAEMGNEVDREAPFYFTKSAHALCLSGSTIPYPLESKDVHYEMELVVALGSPAFRVTVDAAHASVFGYACGIDLTRRDLQAQAKDKRRPWDLGKDFEDAAIVSSITPTIDFGMPTDQTIQLYHNDKLVQDAILSDMVWSVAEVISHLSRFYHLDAGDLIYTGTPAGVGPIASGSQLRGEIKGLEPVSLVISDPL